MRCAENTLPGGQCPDMEAQTARDKTRRLHSVVEMCGTAGSAIGEYHTPFEQEMQDFF